MGLSRPKSLLIVANEATSERCPTTNLAGSAGNTLNNKNTTTTTPSSTNKPYKMRRRRKVAKMSAG